MKEDPLYLSLDEDECVPNTKKTSTQIPFQKKVKKNFNRYNTEKRPNAQNEDTVETYADLKEKIRLSFGEGVVTPVMQLNLLYCEKHTTMFNYRKGPCRKGKYHGHKTLTNFITCCDDSFALLNYKLSYVKRRDKGAAELIQKRIDMHYKNVEKGTQESLIHMEILILNIFASRTTVVLEDLKKIFYDVYKIELSQFCKKHSILRTLQLLNSPNMITSVTQKAINIVCVPTFRSEFSHYKNFKKEYKKALDVEDNIMRPKIETLNKINLMDQADEKNFKSNSNKLFKNKKLQNLLYLSDINVPRPIQKKIANVPRPSELYKEVETDEGVDPVWAFILQALRLDDEEDTFFDINKD